MSTLIYCLSDKIANVFRAQLADTPISFSATDTEDLVSAVLSNNADFLLIQIQRKIDAAVHGGGKGAYHYISHRQSVSACIKL